MLESKFGEIHSQKDTGKLRALCKTLRQEETPREDLRKVIDKAETWIKEAQKDEIDKVARPLFNLLVEKQEQDLFLNIFFNLCRREEKELQPNQSIIRTIFTKLTMSDSFLEKWREHLTNENYKITTKTIIQIIREKMNKGKLEDKQKWEQFQEKYTQTTLIIETKQQQCDIYSRAEYVNRDEMENPNSIIVWNGNGIRARWNSGESELRRVVHATQADVLCFLESKTDSEKLLELQGFQEWITEQKYKRIFCHWSESNEKIRRGCEGIVIFSKKKCKITTGINNKELDQQARVALIEFENMYLLISYHPQGGFTTTSQTYRKEWEKQFTNYLTKLRSKTLSENKFLIWAGDLNVNPHPSDWSIRAFDPIKNKLGEGEPIGCRKEDQEAYEKMLEEIKGKNLGETCGNTKRTCFPNEYSLTRNYGQRIDHAIAQNELLRDDAALRIKNFDVLQEFGASRRNCSDHCPLLIELETNKTEGENKGNLKDVKGNENLSTPIINEMKAVAVSILQEKENVQDEALRLSEAIQSNQEEEITEEECFLSNSKAFEDEPMPVLRGLAGEQQVKILIDSGAAINLITKELAKKLCSQGNKIERTEGINIKVANGLKEAIRETITIPLKLNEQETQRVKFFILQNLPFDILIGNPTLYEWNAIMEWKTKTITLQPFINKEKKLELQWHAYKGQHWRKPVSILCREQIILPPFTQTAVPIIPIAQTEKQGIAGRAAIVTPSRDKHTLMKNFSAAYGYVEDVEAFQCILIANVTAQPIKIAENAKIAELHFREAAVSEVRKSAWKTEGKSCDELELRQTVGPPCPSSYNTCTVQEGTPLEVAQPPQNNSDHVEKSAEKHAEPSSSGLPHTTLDAKTVHGEGNGSEGTVENPQQVNAPVQGNSQAQKNLQQISIEEKIDWTAFEKEPLKSVDLTELRKQRTEEEVRKLASLLIKYQHLLSDGMLDFTNTDSTKHSTTAIIKTLEDNPKIVARGMRCDPIETQAFETATEKLKKEGIIEPSNAPWCSNAILVRKDGKIRMVIDYRALNRVTVRDSYPMPRIQDVTDTLRGTQWFTSIDCVQAFHQIPMGDERSKDLTTFRGPSGGLYRYRYMPMGLVNAMAIWSRFIDTAMEGMKEFVLCYADDVLIYTKHYSVDKHIEDLENVFKRLEQYGIKIKASKMKLGLTQMPFLGVTITAEGIKPNPEKTEAISKMEYPKTITQLRSVVGMFAYYRRFIPKFSEIAAPLYEQSGKSVRNPKNSKGHIRLTQESINSFEILKRKICEEPILLHYPDWEAPFEIHTDASSKAAAAVLCQRIDAKERVIMYASKTLSATEQKYHSYEQEALAVVWAVEVFRKYIRNKKTLVLTDCAALQWLKTKDQNSRVMRWIVKLGEFDLDIKHRKGSQNQVADCLTRDGERIRPDYGIEEIDTLYDEIQVNTMIKAKPFFKCAEDKEAETTQDFLDAQADPDSKCMQHIKANLDKWNERGILYSLKDGLYVAKKTDKDLGKIIVPESLRASILEKFHNSELAAHQGTMRTLLQVSERFYWPSMTREIKKWVQGCMNCRRRKTPRPLRAGITEPALATYPNETVAIDIWGPLPKTEKGNCFVLTMIDTFTRWPVAIPIPDKSSATIAEVIFKYWICEKSVPLKIISDRAREFISKGMKQLARKHGIKMITTSGYNPTGNSSVERYHRYLNATLCIVYDKLKANWDDYLPAILFSYRVSINATTGHSPFFLETGRQPQLPLNNLFSFLRKEEKGENYVQAIQDKLEFAFERTRTLQEEAALKNQKRLPEKHTPKFKPGDYLFVLARSAKEGRLEEKDEEGKTITLPEKLRNPFIGPYRMIRWKDVRKRACVLDIDGEEITHNVNRLIRHHIWDEAHHDTNVGAAKKKKKAEEKLEKVEPLKIGDIVVTSKHPGQDCEFGVARILEIKGTHNIECQWYGNWPKTKAKRPFIPFWVDGKDEKHYPLKKPRAKTHEPYTNAHTKHDISINDIIVYGNILSEDGKFDKTVRSKIEEEIGEICWK